jgi:spore maturation protein CgeB
LENPQHPVFSGTRVLVIGSNANEDSFEAHVSESLAAMGCVPRLLHNIGNLSVIGKALNKAALTVLREPERRREPGILRAAAEFAPDVILVLLGNQLSPKTVEALRKTSRVPIVCWCQDQLSTLGRQYLLGAAYDAVYVKDRYMQSLFSRMIRSAPFYYLPEACNPRVHRPLELTDAEAATYGCDLMIAGTLYYYRQEILQELRDFDVKVWGYRPDWLVDRMPGRFMGRDVRGDQKVRATLAARICLNTLHYAEVDGLNCRAFEIAGCGGFQLVSEVSVLGEHFEPDVEVVAFRNVEELREKARYYLERPELRREIAARGRARAHRDHTYENRLVEILTRALGRSSIKQSSPS